MGIPDTVSNSTLFSIENDSQLALERINNPNKYVTTPEEGNQGS